MMGPEDSFSWNAFFKGHVNLRFFFRWLKRFSDSSRRNLSRLPIWWTASAAGLRKTKTRKTKCWLKSRVLCFLFEFQWVLSGWWFQIFFVFTPILGEVIQFDEHIFQMGWNHQHVIVFEIQCSFNTLLFGWVIFAVFCWWIFGMVWAKPHLKHVYDAMYIAHLGTGSESIQFLIVIWRICVSIPINWICPYQGTSLVKPPPYCGCDSPRCRREVPKGLSDTVPPIQCLKFFGIWVGKGEDGCGCEHWKKPSCLCFFLGGKIILPSSNGDYVIMSWNVGSLLNSQDSRGESRRLFFFVLMWIHYRSLTFHRAKKAGGFCDLQRRGWKFGSLTWLNHLVDVLLVEHLMKHKSLWILKLDIQILPWTSFGVSCIQRFCFEDVASKILKSQRHGKPIEMGVPDISSFAGQKHGK